MVDRQGCERRIGKAERADIGVGDEQAAPGRQQLAEPFRRALTRNQLGTVMELIVLHAPSLEHFQVGPIPDDSENAAT